MGIVYELVNHSRRPATLADGDSRPEPLQDEKITAGHILQLCKFLAEKSKRNNKSLLKRQKQNLEYTSKLRVKLEQDVNREGEIRKDMETHPNREPAVTESMRSEETTTTALPLIKHNRNFVDASLAGLQKQMAAPPQQKQQQPQQQQQSCVILPSFSSSASCSMQHQQQGNKKDILQKIRNQILERKRQRQLASVQRLEGVWRPW